MKTTLGQLQLFSNPRRRVKKARQKSVTPTRTSGRVPHETRPDVKGPIHVVWRIRRGLPSLRTPRGLRRLERAFRLGKEREGFALLHYSIQEDHLHLMVEVKDRKRLSRALQALGIRLAKQLNSLWRRRRGSVFAERYFALALKTYHQIWRTIRYVVNNGRKHGTWRVKDQPDPYSSGRWYRPWQKYIRRRPFRRAPVLEPKSFEIFVPILIDDAPGPRWQEFPVSSPH